MIIRFIIFLVLFGSCTPGKDTDPDKSIFASTSYHGLPPQEKLKFLDSIATSYSPTHNDTIARAFLFELSSEYYYMNAHKKSLNTSRSVLQLAKEAGDSADIGRAYYYIGDSYELTKKDSAYFYYLEAEKIFRKIHDDERTGKMIFNKAYILFYDGNYIESEIELSKALLYLKDTNNYRMLFSCYTLMGSNSEKLEDFDNAMQYYHKSADVLNAARRDNADFDRQNNYRVTASINIANIYEKTGKYEQAIRELESVLTEDLKLNWPSEYAVVIENIGYCKMKTGDLVTAEKFLLKALALSQKHDSESKTLYKLNNLGEYYLLVKDTGKSLTYLRQSLEIAERVRSSEELKTTLKLLSKADYKNDALYKERYIREADSLAKIQRKNRNKYARIEYETAMVEDQNKVLVSKNYKIINISIILIVLLTTVLILRYIKSQNRELNFKKQQQSADEEIFELLKKHQAQVNRARVHEQQRIAKELHDGIMNKLYGVRMQLGLLNNSDDDNIKNKRLQYVDMLQEIENEVRIISHDLNLDMANGDTDYISLLINLVEQQNELGKTRFRFKHDPDIDWTKISGLIKITINRVIQEAISNVHKYAEAHECMVSVMMYGTVLQLTIEDDGKGFDAQPAKSSGIGLNNMKERAQMINAVLTIESRRGQGTKIQINISLSK